MYLTVTLDSLINTSYIAHIKIQSPVKRYNVKNGINLTTEK